MSDVPTTKRDVSLNMGDITLINSDITVGMSDGPCSGCEYRPTTFSLKCYEGKPHYWCGYKCTVKFGGERTCEKCNFSECSTCWTSRGFGCKNC